MQATDLASRLIQLIEHQGDAQQIDDAVLAHVTRALRAEPQRDPADVIKAQSEAVSEALHAHGISYGTLGQVWDSFRKATPISSAATPHIPTANALTPPAENTRATQSGSYGTPASYTPNPAPQATTAPQATAAPQARPQPQPAPASNTTQYINNYASQRPQSSGFNRYGGMGVGGMGIGAGMGMGMTGMGMGLGTNSAMLQMDAMQDDMMANQLMMEGEMLAATGNVAAGMQLENDAMMLENQANMDRMFADMGGMGGMGGGFGTW